MKQAQFYKLIFTGPPGAGKTTAISALSDVEVISTEAKITNPDPNQPTKQTLTVGLDYGSIKLSNKEKVHLYGTPGQERFDFMWDILSTGGIGLVILLDNTRPDPFVDLRFFLETFSDFIDKTSVVIGVTQMDNSPKPTIGDYHLQLKGAGLNPAIFEVDARESKDVSLLVQGLLYSLDPGLEE